MASDKDGGFGGLDLYSFELDDNLRPNPVTYIKGRVKDAESGMPLEATVEMVDLRSNVLLNVSASDYPFYSENFQIEKSYTALEPYLKDINLQKAEVGTVVVLKNVFFDFDRSDLQPSSYVELDKLVDYLEHNRVNIEIAGHTDNQGSDEYNDRLSMERAKAVYDYLVQHGVAADRLSYRGYGKRHPIADNETEEGRAANRRTEFRIVP